MKTASTRKRTRPRCTRLSLTPATRASTGFRWVYFYNSTPRDSTRADCWVVQCVLGALQFSFAVSIQKAGSYDAALRRVLKMRNAMLRFYGTPIPD